MRLSKNIRFVFVLFLLLTKNTLCSTDSLESGLLDTLPEDVKSRVISSIETSDNKAELIRLFNEAFNTFNWNSKEEKASRTALGIRRAPEQDQLMAVMDFFLSDLFDTETYKGFLSLFLPRMDFQHRQEIVDHLHYFKYQPSFIFIEGIQKAAEEIGDKQDLVERKTIIEKYLPCCGYMMRR